MRGVMEKSLFIGPSEQLIIFHRQVNIERKKPDFLDISPFKIDYFFEFG